MITNIRLKRKFGFRNKSSNVLSSRRFKGRHYLITFNKPCNTNTRKVKNVIHTIRKRQKK